MQKRLKESRHFPRVSFSGNLRCQERGSKEFANTISENLSLSGVKFINSQFMAPKTPVMLEINLLSQVVKIIAQIIWSSPFPRQDKFHLGAQFLEWDRKDVKILSDFINLKVSQ